jgi:2-oxoglutarate ferredoxin oxidoreductase subunit beta
MATMADLNSGHMPTWCPGCGDFPILIAIKNALVKGGFSMEETVVVSGIGCSGKLPHFLKSYAFESIHGRALPVASGVKLCNDKLNVLAVGGDGDGYGIGMGHFIHSLRRNINMCYIVHDNQIYGLTTGQTSPTSERGFKTKSTPNGALEDPVNPLAVAITGGATYVARGFSGDLPHLSEMILRGMQHRGFALVDVLQPCVTFNKLNTYEYFTKRCYKLTPEMHDPADRAKAYALSWEWGDKIPLGVLYEVKKETYEDGLPQIKDTPLCKQDIEHIDIKKLIDEYVA